MNLELASDPEWKDEEYNMSHEEDGTDFLVVGIGASAGGVQALQSFFENVPENAGVAYVVILHLSPHFDSQLAAVLQAITKLPVQQVTDTTFILPDNVYVVPPNKHLIVAENNIHVSPNTQVEDRHAPVDIFFRSLAEAYGPRAISVILSGTGANGSMGLKRVKERGGAAFVQNPREAEFNEMPRNAITTDLVDEVLPVADIPRKIIDYKKSRNTVKISVDAEVAPSDEQSALREIFSQLRLRTGHDFSSYKRPTILRRIERRIRVRELDDIGAYARFLSENPEESTFLLKDLLISVTNFFRDKKVFEVIEKEIIPGIFKNKNPSSPVRIWVAGCATGEEAYSLAMLCAEITSGMVDAPKIHIFATDIDEAAIAQARDGIYTINDAADVSPERLRRFFRKDGQDYRIKREIREMILFANHNFIKDPPFSHLDMITCRNVLIYLNHTAKERVMETFHFALKPGGFLVLGTSETTDGAADLYAAFNRDHHIYQARTVSLHTYPVPESVPSLVPTKPYNIAERDQGRSERISYGELHHQLLEKYAPPSIVINEEHDILHMSEHAGQYLQISGGEPTQNLLKLVKPELRLELRSAIYQALETRMETEVGGVLVTINGVQETVNLRVLPVFGGVETGQVFMLVLFEAAVATNAIPRTIVAMDEPIVRRLEEEVSRLKNQLRSSNEHHEFQAEELKAANEELQAMNEETRSAAEELETSKEELQSVNEELRTVNQELKLKVEETTIASNNLQNLINSVDIASIFLDRSLRINLYSPAAREIFNVIPADTGRLLSNITHNLNYNGIMSDAARVLERLLPVEREVVSNRGTTYNMRVLPYRTEEDRINGVVVTFIDITNYKKVERELRESEERLRLIMESAIDFGILMIDTERRVVSWNKGAEVLFGYLEHEIVGKSGDVVFVPEDRKDEAPVKEAQTALKEGKAENERWHLRKDGSRFYGSGMVRSMFDSKQQHIGFLKIMRDLTERKRSEDAVRESELRLRITMNSATDYSIITLNTEGLIEGWSKGAEYIFGYTEEEAKGQHASLIFTPEDIAAKAPQKEQAEAATQGRAVDERWHMKKDGTRFYMSGIMTPIKFENKIVGYVKVARDLTERKLVEEQKDDFIGIASHELKTPVTSIKAYTELLDELVQEKADAHVSDIVMKLDAQVDRLIELIHALLDTTRISQGKLGLSRQLVDINKLIAGRLEELRPISSIHTLVFDAGVVRPVPADEDRIGQVLTNLVSNAIKYSPKGGDVIVRSREWDNQVRIDIEDSGFGISEEHKEKVFERFFRLPNPQVRSASGMGLGLYISSGIVQAHGGKIWVNSMPGRGTTFSFTIPFTEEPVAG